MPKKKITSIPDIIPSELQLFIREYVNPKKFKNCGEFYSMIMGKDKLHEIQMNPSLLLHFKRFVLKSLVEFQRRLQATKIIRFCAAGPERRMILVRVTEAVKIAKRTNNAQELMGHCKMIKTWKVECRIIQQRLSHIATLLPREFCLAKLDYKKLYIRGKKLRGLYWPHYVADMLNCISHDAEILKALTSTIDIRSSATQKTNKEQPEYMLGFNRTKQIMKFRFLENLRS